MLLVGINSKWSAKIKIEQFILTRNVIWRSQRGVQCNYFLHHPKMPCGPEYSLCLSVFVYQNCEKLRFFKNLSPHSILIVSL